ncbi:hypothetical protein [Paraburkholderia bannensis]|uniref:hypothetical protein n=1 Tax=Paraburkholderia bannensis TaxID=765414 RepID=UPI0012EC94A6|nr:hypothetical protein [Paraburkholderia bannensis]
MTPAPGCNVGTAIRFAPRSTEHFPNAREQFFPEKELDIQTTYGYQRETPVSAFMHSRGHNSLGNSRRLYEYDTSIISSALMRRLTLRRTQYQW